LNTSCNLLNVSSFPAEYRWRHNKMLDGKNGAFLDSHIFSESEN